LIDHLQYNSNRNQLHIPEYGRNVQKMVEYALTVEDREKRNQIAELIIDVMGNIAPHLRDVVDFQHKLWDQLFIISDFQLEVDSPFPIPTREDIFSRPEPLEYPQNHPKYRFYGNNIKLMIDEAVKIEDQEKKNGLITAIANHMKKCFLNWNRDAVKDVVIFKHLKELSNGEIDIDPESKELRSASDLVQKRPKQQSNTKKHQKYAKHNRNRKRR